MTYRVPVQQEAVYHHPLNLLILGSMFLFYFIEARLPSSKDSVFYRDIPLLIEMVVRYVLWRDNPGAFDL